MQVYVRSDHFSRSSQAQVNTDLQSHLASESEGQEACLLSVISWVQDHLHLYLTPDTKQEKEETPLAGGVEEKFSRYWIYSHHIYSKVKRKNILDLAAQYCLTGFCLPGKPGVICIEGEARNCSEWWSLVRSWNWQRLSIKVQEDLTSEDVDSLRLFGKFEEIGVVKNTERSNHMDMGEFQKYLESHNCQWIFKELFSIKDRD